MRRTTIAYVASVAAVLGTIVLAGPDTVKLPENYQAEFVNYMDVDRLDRIRVRKMWVNPEARAAAVAGRPLPDGTILIMEDWAAKLDDNGEPVFDESGRLIADEPSGHRFVMEKNAAWSTANENWDYAWYQGDDLPRPDASFDGCFSCHANRTERDYTFTFWKFVEDAQR